MTVYLLGLDGASLNTIQETMSRTRLPNFEKLLRDGSYSDLHSVYPYVTAPAWTTIFSGVNPGKHGIFEMFEVREDKIVPSNMRATRRPFSLGLSYVGGKALSCRGSAFHLSGTRKSMAISLREDSRLAILLSRRSVRLSLTFRDLTTMTCRWKKKRKKSSRKVPENLRKNSRRSGKKDRDHDAAGGLQRMGRGILVDGLPDDFLHISYGDDEIVDKMYLKLDRFVGLVLAEDESEDSLLVFSDHGFCKVENVLFINEWLLKKQFSDLHRNAGLSRFLMSLGINWDSFSEQWFTSKLFRFFLGHFPWAASRIKKSLDLAWFWTNQEN